MCAAITCKDYLKLSKKEKKKINKEVNIEGAILKLYIFSKIIQGI